MKKIIYLLAFLIALFIGFSCNDDLTPTSGDYSKKEAKPDKNPVTAIISAVRLNKSQAEKALFRFIRDIEPNTRSQVQIRITGCDSIAVNAPIKTRGVTNPNTFIYHFNLETQEGEGYALVTNYPVGPKVFAYVPKGNLEIDTIKNKILADYIKNIQQKQEFDDSKFKIKKSLTRRSFPELPSEYDSIVVDSIVQDTLFRTIYYDEFVFNTLMKFIVPVTWGQEYPYNKDVPYQCGSGKAPVGCVAVAIAQIMAYHKYPSNYNWDLLTQTPTISGTLKSDEARRNEVARLMVDIGQKVEMNYGCSGSGSNIEKARAALGQYGYYTSKINDVITSFSKRPWMGLDAYQNPDYLFYNPMYIRGANNAGEGHAFIADAKSEFSEQTWVVRLKYVNGEYVDGEWLDWDFPFVGDLWDIPLLVHINWGWDGYSNGWYVYNFLKDGDNSFSNSMMKIQDIYPK
jgi:hypothetical protein